MINRKTKTAYPLTLEEVKKHLRIDPDEFDDDSYLENFILKAATRYCENFIDRDIALTSNVLTYPDFYDEYLRVDEGNLVSIDHIISDTSTLITGYTYTQEDTFFEISFDSYIDNDPLTVQFTTGYEEGTCPEEIMQAILIKCGDLYDVERSSYTLGSAKKEAIVDRILMPFKAIRW